MSPPTLPSIVLPCSRPPGLLPAAGAAAGAGRGVAGLTPPGSWRVRLSVRSWLSSQCASVPAATERGISVRTLPVRQARQSYLFAQGGATAPAVSQQGLNQY